jgi:hypothetical protein
LFVSLKNLLFVDKKVTAVGWFPILQMWQATGNIVNKLTALPDGMLLKNGNGKPQMDACCVC